MARPVGSAGRGRRPEGIASFQQEIYRALNESAEAIETNTRNHVRDEMREMHINEHEDQIQILNARIEQLERFQDAPQRPRRIDGTMQLERRIKSLPWMEEKKTNQVKAFIRHADAIHQSINEDEDELFLNLVRDKLAPCIWLNANSISSAIMWQDLRFLLEESIREEDAHASLKLRISELRQKSGEDLSEYNKRADKLWEEYEELHNNMSAAHRKEAQESLRTAYERGIANFRVRQRVRDQPNESLTEAKKMARIFTQREREDGETREIICNFCQRRGHREIECSTKQRMVEQSNQAAAPANGNYCTKCESMGHTIRSCMVIRPQSQNATNNQNAWKPGSNRGNWNNSRSNWNDNRSRNGNSNYAGSGSTNYFNRNNQDNRYNSNYGRNSNGYNGNNNNNNNRNPEGNGGFRNNYQGNNSLNRNHQNAAWPNNNSNNGQNQNRTNSNIGQNRNEQQQGYRSFTVQATQQQGNE